MTAKLGLDGKIYRNTGTYASPSWNEITNAKDVSLNLEKGRADVTTRGNNGWRAEKGTLKNASVTFSMVDNDGDADLDAIKDAFIDNDEIEILVLDGDILTSGSEGLRATMDVVNFTRTENLEEAIMYEVELTPAYSANPPEWYEVA